MTSRLTCLLLILPAVACASAADEANEASAAGTNRTELSVCPKTAFPSGRTLRHDAFEEDDAFRAAETSFLAKLDAACAEVDIDRKTCTSDVEGESHTGFKGACLSLCSSRADLNKPKSPFAKTTDAHKTALILYTEHEFEALGSALWGAWDWDPLNPAPRPLDKRKPIETARVELGEQESLAFMLKGALAKVTPAPASAFEDGHVFRGDFWGQEGLPELLEKGASRFRDSIPAEGSIYTVPSFWSTTRDPQTHFMRAPLVYRIKTKKATAGRPLEEISSRPDEREILFPPCTSFRVTGKRVLENAAIDGRRPLVVGGEEVKFDRQFVVTLEEQ
jgi:hypothetical protein